jgi:hypothetical protein
LTGYVSVLRWKGWRLVLFWRPFERDDFCHWTTCACTNIDIYLYPSEMKVWQREITGKYKIMKFWDELIA